MDDPSSSATERSIRADDSSDLLHVIAASRGSRDEPNQSRPDDHRFRARRTWETLLNFSATSRLARPPPTQRIAQRQASRPFQLELGTPGHEEAATPLAVHDRADHVHHERQPEGQRKDSENQSDSTKSFGEH